MENKNSELERKEDNMSKKENHSSVYIYPAIFTPEDKGMYSISFPDIENCCTCGDNLEDGMMMAEDALALMIYSNYEEKILQAPDATPIEKIKLNKGEFVTYVVCDTLEYRKRFGTKAVKKTLSIPEWLNDAAVKKKINFSQVLQEALKDKLNVS